MEPVRILRVRSGRRTGFGRPRRVPGGMAGNGKGGEPAGFRVPGRPLADVHFQAQIHAGELPLDLVERPPAEVLGKQHLLLGHLHQIADMDDVVAPHVVRGPGREAKGLNPEQQPPIKLSGLGIIRHERSRTLRPTRRA